MDENFENLTDSEKITELYNMILELQSSSGGEESGDGEIDLDLLVQRVYELENQVDSLVSNDQSGAVSELTSQMNELMDMNLGDRMHYLETSIPETLVNHEERIVTIETDEHVENIITLFQKVDKLKVQVEKLSNTLHSTLRRLSHFEEMTNSHLSLDR